MTLTIRTHQTPSHQVATIALEDGVIQTRLPQRDDDFVDLVRELHYRCDGAWWARRPSERSGPLLHRAAELGRALLEAGYIVTFPAEDVQALAVSGDYEPECRRWILRDEDKFRVWWGYELDYYNEAREITGSFYDSTRSAVLVPRENFAEVLDFAEAYGFSLTEAAQRLVAEVQAWFEALPVVSLGEAELVARPETPTSALTAVIEIDDHAVRVRLSRKDERFVEIVKCLHYVWNGAWWARVLKPRMGRVSHRAAELGQALLAAGYMVEFPNEAIRALAISGAYEPECRKWILWHERGFRVWWGPELDFFHEAKRIAASTYDASSYSVIVPREYFNEVLGFAETYDFRIAAKAQQQIDQARAWYDGAQVVDVAYDPANQQTAYVRPKLKTPAHVDVPVRLLDYAGLDFGVTTRLYSHQQRAVDKLRDLRVGALFMAMGTGKTRTAIELVHRRRQRIRNVVWFCPVSLKETIAYEIDKHTDTPPNQIYIFDDTTTMRTLPRAFWYIVGLESISGSDRVTLTAHNLIDADSFVIVDESSYIKGHNSLRTQRVTRMGHKARYRLILTGTPVSQGVVDLFAQMRFLDPAILGYNSFYSFEANHLEYSEKYPGLVVRSHNEAWLAAKMQPYVYQVTKEECLDLPDKLFDTRYYRMTSEQRDLYEQAKYDILFSLPDEDIDSYVIFQLFTALQQIVSGFWQQGETLWEVPHYRLEHLVQALEDLPDGKKVVIWCKYRYSVRAIADRLREDYGEDAVALFYGDLNEHARNQELARWRAEARFLVATMATGGYGLDLTAAHYSIFYENDFKYSLRLQSEDRIHRIGQDKHPTYIDLVCRQSIDERIQDALATKGNAADAFRREVERVKDAGREALERMVKAL
jgi:hypothetical protein